MGNKVKIRRKTPTAVYPGSLVQQNFGESIEKGYVMWDTDTLEHERKYILNDYGFAKIDISRGEDVEDRIDNIKFSNNTRKTKVYITWKDYGENYSIEKESQIKRLVKDKFSCESVRVEFSEISRDIAEIDEGELNSRPFNDILNDWIEEVHNPDKELLDDILLLSSEVDRVLEIDENYLDVMDDWSLESMEINNILSFDDESTIIDFNKIIGIAGIFGKNFNGKSNVIKALVWGLYDEIVGGEQSSSKFLVNIYTKSNSGFVKIYLTINGELYRIIRKITTNKGTNKNTYKTIYEKKSLDTNGKEFWEKTISDSKTAEQKEVKDLILNAIGSFDDFTKTSLQSQGGSDDYINQKQQPKNTLISRFFGLEPCRLRLDYTKIKFNEIKKKQKDLGNLIETEMGIKDILVSINENKKNKESIQEERDQFSKKTDSLEEEINDLNKSLYKIEPSGIQDLLIEESRLEVIKKDILNKKETLDKSESWLSNNFKKELPFDENVNVNLLSSTLNSENIKLSNMNVEVSNINLWLTENPLRTLEDVSGFSDNIIFLNQEVSGLSAKITAYQGKKCPTCNNIEQKADPIQEEACVEEVKIREELIQIKNNKIIKYNNDVNHNNSVSNNLNLVSVLVQKVIVSKKTSEEISNKINLINSSKDIIDHNKKFDIKHNEIKIIRKEIGDLEQSSVNLSSNIELFKSNKNKVEFNKNVSVKIGNINENKKTFKLSIFSLDKQITIVLAEIKVLEKDSKNLECQINEINDFDRLYKKYSIYTQAVHRDGIPASIIRKKLPLVNNKVNSILETIVDFKLDMSILNNGNIVETFYFSDDKSDALPLSSSSGSQKFISSIVITEALRYMSRLTKPSIRIIDEGFGSLDDELTMGIENILSYLRSKYKNVLIITHRNEIKDFADKIIEVTKVPGNIDKEVLENNPKAGVSKISIR